MTNLFVMGSPRGQSPCVAHACTACCRDTNMPLSLADIERITALGHKLAEFSDSGDDGWMRLHNLDDHRCFFLSEKGLCTIHDSKPEGCRLYPFILDQDTAEVFRDSFCPFNAQFDPAPTTKEKVRELVVRLEDEAAARRDQAGRHRR